MKNKLFLIFLFLAQIVFANKPDLFLLKTYDTNINVIGWLVSEKLDGVRGFWDGKKLVSRSGKIFNPPKWWIKDFPNFAIDGELWTKQGDFENIVSIVQTQKADIRWQAINFNIFEVPNQQGGLLKRLKVLRKYLMLNPSKYIKIIQQTKIKTKLQLETILAKVIKNKGEGVVVRDPDTPYQIGRLSSALKIKKYLDDECIVRKILLGKGKYQNKMGAVKCEMKNGKIIKIGSGFKDYIRENPFKIGTIITFKYYGLTKKGNLKYPVFLRIKTK